MPASSPPGRAVAAAILLAALAAVTGLAALTALTGLAPAAPPAPPAPQAPPAPPAAADGSLPEELRRILSSSPLSSSRASVQVLDSATGESLYAHQPERMLKPASNMKLLTAAAALALLRPEYKFKTRFYADAAPGPNGVVRGNFYLKGGGSPGLVGEDWWLIARRLRALGITKIEGDLIGDDTFFDDVRRGRSWPSPRVDNPYNAPVSALACFFNAVAVTVRPGMLGKPPEVFLEPFGGFFQVSNRAITSGKGRNIRVSRTFDGEKNIIHVSGRIGAGARPYTTYKSVETPTAYALHAFRQAARREEIAVAGRSRRGIVPDSAHLIWTHESRPVAYLIRDMNKESNNFMAESILKTIGAEQMGAPGTTAKGAQVVRSWLEGLGVSTEGIVIADGSGLSSDNRLSADALAQVLRVTAQDFQSAPEFVTSLPVGGVDGTLDGRMVETPAMRNVRAKTGFIRGVTSLSGYAMNRGGRRLVFSVLVNGLGDRVWEGSRSVDRICNALVESDLPEPAPPSAPGG